MKNMTKDDFQAAHTIGVGALDFRGAVLARVWAPDVSEGPTGRVEKSVAAGPRLVRLRAESLSVDANAGEVHCSGDVSVRSQELDRSRVRSLDCQELQMSLLEGMTGIKQVVATDRVVLESQGRIATGGKLVFDGVRNVAELTRQPKVWYGENVILGRKVSYNVETGIFSVLDDVRGEFYTEKELKVADNRGGEQASKSQASKIGARTLEEEASLSLSESIRRPGKIEFSADKLDYNEKTMEGSYSGGVVIRKGEAVFSADSIKMVGNPVSGSIETLLAQGNVRVQDGARVLLADQATYYNDEQKVVLLGSPKVFEFGKIITRGAVVTLYLGKKEFEIEGQDEAKIKTTFFLPKKK
jgi:lipopolysaccharide transport protein LptA